MTAPVSTRRQRVALIVPSSNTVMENDLHAALPKSRFTVHTDRMFLVETTREAETQMIEKYAQPAASDLGTLKPDVLVFGCTSAGSLFGLEGDQRVCAQLSDLAGCPTLGVINAVEQSLQRAGAKRLAVLTPYNEDLTQSVATAVSEGREIVGAFGLGITDNEALALPTPEDILAFAHKSLAGLRFDSILVSCTNFRALEAAPRLQAAFGVPVVTSNLAVIEAIEAMFA
jgi:maleate isomerase